MNTSIIPIVLCADNSYAIPLFVTVVSALKSKNESTEYQFHFLISEDFSKNIIASIEKILAEYNCPEANWINMGQQYAQTEMHLKHISSATYYRLQLPHILKEDKCIYLDVDVCVCKDLTEFFSTDISSDYMAGVKAAGYYVPESRLEERAQTLKIEKFDRYVNAGILLLNIGKIRQDNLAEKFDELMQYNFGSQDQDILNSACYPAIKILEPKYNVMTKYPLSIEDYDTTESLKACFTKDEWKEASERPVIIHYADVKKPWMYSESVFADIWWDNFNKADKYIADKSLWADDLLVFYKLTQERHILNEDKALHSVDLRNEKIKTLNEDISNKKKTISDRDKVIATSKTKIEGLESEKKKLNENISALKNDVQTLKSDNSKLNNQLTTQKKINNDVTEKLNKTTANLNETSAKLSDSKKANEKLTSEKNNLITEKKNLIADKKSLNKKLKDIKNSKSYKIGRVITYIPRKLKKLIVKH